MFTLDQLRAAGGGLDNLTDEEIIQATYPQFRRYYPSMDDFAAELGYGGAGRGKNASRLSSSIDRYQAGMLGLGEAATGFDFLRKARERNESAAGYAEQRAAELGAISSYRDIGGLGDAGDYVLGLGIQSAPYIGEALVGGLAGRAALGGAMGLRGATAAGAVGATYPSAVGDVLQNQRDQAGETDLGSAAALGVPYAGLNLLGVEGAAARGTLFRSGIPALDRLSGVRGGLARTAVSGARTAGAEGFSETGQEALNQMGRIAVDPSASMDDPEAMERYGESFVGGAALGGAFGSVGGGWRRTQGYSPLEANPDLLQRDLPDISMEPPVPVAPPGMTPEEPVVDVLPGNPEVAVAQGEVQTDQPSMADEVRQEAARRRQEFTAASQRAAEYGLKSPKQVELYQELERLLQADGISANEYKEALVELSLNKLGTVRAMVKRIDNALEGKRLVQEQQAKGGEDVGVSVPAAPVVAGGSGQPSNDVPGSVAGDGPVPDAGAGAGGGAATGPGVPGGAALPDGRPDGQRAAPVTRPQLVEKDGVVTISGTPIQTPAGVEAAMKRFPGYVPQEVEGGFVLKRQGAVDVPADASPAVQQTAPATAPEGQRQVVTRQAGGKKTLAAPEQVKHALRNLGSRDRGIVLDALGLDEEGNQVDQPMSYTDIGKKHGISRQAVQHVLKRVGVTKAVVDRLAGVGMESVSEAEILGNTEEGGATGMRVMDRPSQGDDFELDARTRRAQKESDEALKKAGAASVAEAEERIAAKKRAADEAFEQKRRMVAEQSRVMAETREQARQARAPAVPEFEQADLDYAKSEWNLGSVEGDPIWDELTEEEQHRFTRAASAYGEDKISGQALERVHGSIADEVKARRAAPEGVVGQAAERVLPGGSGGAVRRIPGRGSGDSDGAAQATRSPVGEGEARNQGPDAQSEIQSLSKGWVDQSPDNLLWSHVQDAGSMVTRKPDVPLNFLSEDFVSSKEGEYSYRAPPNYIRRGLSAVAQTLLNTKFPAFSHALSRVQLGVFGAEDASPGTQGFYHRSKQVVALWRGAGLNQIAEDSRRQLPVVYASSILAHELTHALDFQSATDIGAPRGSSMSHNSSSKTFMHLHARGIETGPVMREVFSKVVKFAPYFLDGVLPENTQAMNDSNLAYDFLQYPLAGMLNVYRALGPMSPYQRTQFIFDNQQAISEAEWMATTELVPMLVQMRLSKPADMQRVFPQAYDFVNQLLASKTAKDVARAYGVSDGDTEIRDVQDRGQSRIGQDRGGYADLHRAVQARAGTGNQTAVSGVRVGDAQGAGDGRSVWRTYPAPGSASRLGSTGSINNLPPPPSAPQGLKGWMDGIAHGKWRAAPWLLGWLSTEQLADRFKDLPGKAGQAVQTFHRGMTKMSVRANTLMNMSDRHKRRWETLRRALGEQADKQFADFLIESTMSQIWPMHPLESAENDHVPHTLEKQADGTSKKVWSPKTIAEHAKLLKMWQALPDGYKALHGQLQADFQLKYEAKVKAFRQNIVNSHYPPNDSRSLTKALVDQAAAIPKRERRAFTKKHGETKLAVDTFRALWSDLDEHAREFPSKLAGPYFPLMRFGEHIISVRSAKYAAAEKVVIDLTQEMEEAYSAEGYRDVSDRQTQIEVLNKRLIKADRANRPAIEGEIQQIQQELKDLQEPINKLREKLDKAKSELRALKSSEQDYNVEFYESLGQATARKKQLDDHFKGTTAVVKQSLKDQYLRETDGVTPSFMRRMEDRMASELPETEAAQVRRSMRELYLQMLPERSALKSQMRRLGVSGVKAEESMRAYAASSVRDAWYISRLENQEPIRAAMNELRFSEEVDSKLVGQELAKRVAQNLHFEDHRWMSAATNATYLTYLGMSPAFTFMQLTQPYVISMPVIAARHGAAAAGQLVRGWREAAQVLKVSFGKDRSMGFTANPEAAAAAGVITPNEATMLKQLFDSGRIDITITHDMGAAAAGRSEGWLGKATAISAWPAHQAEVLNRVSTALASYRLEKHKLMKDGADEADATKRAIEYADRMVSETHLNYAPENRARFMHASAWGGWGRIMFQFRSYQQGMLYLIFKNLLDGLRGDKDAQRAVAYLAGMQLAVAGTTGLPIAAPAVAVATLIYKGLTDDDEEKDLPEMFHQGVASVLGERGANAVIKGLPAAAGIDLSKRVGMGDIASPAAFANERAEGRDMVAAYWIAITGGAPFGMVSNWAEAMKQADQGQYTKALTYALPKFLADPVRGATLGTKGLVDSRGNVIVEDDQLSAAEVAVKVLGFQPTSLSRTYEKRGAFFEAREARKKGRERVLNELVQAKLEGQALDLAALRQYNEKHPQGRLTVSDVLRAAERRRKERQVMRQTGGVPVRRSEKQLAVELGLQ